MRWLKLRSERSDLHGHSHINKQRRMALIMIVTGLSRVLAWLTLITLYLLGVPFTHALFEKVAFVALISLYANAATDWGQVAASFAQLTAGDAHHDAETTRRELGIDVVSVEGDIARLAELQPGPDADALAAQIRARLSSTKRAKLGD